MRRIFWGVAVTAFMGAWLQIPAQTAPMPAAFEVASIRLHEGPLHRMMDLTISGTLVGMEGYSVFMLIMEAYHVKGFQISLTSVRGQEKEIREAMYDIVARAPGGHAPKRDEVRMMLQNLLADRFGLAVHREAKEMGVHALVLRKRSPALKASNNDSPCSVHVSLAPDGRNEDETFANCTMDALVDQILNLGIDRPVVDKTGVAGKYDFRLVVIPEFKSRRQSQPGDIDIFSAVRGLGLKLDPRKAPVEMVAVDRVHKPTAN